MGSLSSVYVDDAAAKLSRLCPCCEGQFELEIQDIVVSSLNRDAKLAAKGDRAERDWGFVRLLRFCSTVRKRIKGVWISFDRKEDEE
ncbi:hypothetical protein IEQ34_023020 [Dendrobium chrysotoxum]|uniref:Uncharacterized protein n=1 Tax=Dendrobium chrysotoxum TaxID=161865 RepID=A0AAV7FKC0_DENCH|nr:hypothetical protein IEQ34_023020 [Dendrobium chrysotoxum]